MPQNGTHTRTHARTHARTHTHVPFNLLCFGCFLYPVPLIVTNETHLRKPNRAFYSKRSNLKCVWFWAPLPLYILFDLLSVDLLTSLRWLVWSLFSTRDSLAETEHVEFCNMLSTRRRKLWRHATCCDLNRMTKSHHGKRHEAKVYHTWCFRWCSIFVRLKSQRVACPQNFRLRAKSTSQNFTCSARESRVESTWRRLQTNQRRLVSK